jgi:hypothetical protein
MRTTAEIREIESPLSYFFHRSGLLKFKPSLTVGLLSRLLLLSSACSHIGATCKVPFVIPLQFSPFCQTSRRSVTDAECHRPC